MHQSAGNKYSGCSENYFLCSRNSYLSCAENDYCFCQLKTVDEYIPGLTGFVFSIYAKATGDYRFCCEKLVRQDIFKTIYFHDNNLFTKNPSIRNMVDCSNYFLVAPVEEILNQYHYGCSKRILTEKEIQAIDSFINRKGLTELIRFSNISEHYTEKFRKLISEMTDLKFFENLNFDLERLTYVITAGNQDNDDFYNFIAENMNDQLKKDVFTFNQDFENISFPKYHDIEMHVVKYFANTRDFVDKFVEKFPERKKELEQVKRPDLFNNCKIIPELGEYDEIVVNITDDELKFHNEYVDKLLKSDCDFCFVTKNPGLVIGDFSILNLRHIGAMFLSTCNFDNIPVTISKHSIVVHSSIHDNPYAENKFEMSSLNFGFRMFVENSNIDIFNCLVENVYASFSSTSTFTEKGIHVGPNMHNDRFKYNYKLTEGLDTESLCYENIFVSTNNYYSNDQRKSIFKIIKKYLMDHKPGCISPCIQTE